MNIWGYLNFSVPYGIYPYISNRHFLCRRWLCIPGRSGLYFHGITFDLNSIVAGAR
ncbi:hypothetical protein MTYP_01909 [Methylophilaceae bacterium]|nr:hypothetical protein MTYP_01909 [Methylophilaceae bacterium]